ncbi:MAG: hypothetical protein HC902_12585 [Calothrix sp. SM1_5_4]|nr:hypothetical protein [Calothrix sp. SM1_5_4]
MTFIRLGLPATSFILALMIGCHSVPLRSPSSGVDSASQTQWLKDYKRARSLQSENAQESCRLFTALAQEEKFAPRRLAELRAYEVCPPTRQLDRSQFPTWTQDLSLDIALKLSTAQGDKARTSNWPWRNPENACLRATS